MKSADMRLMTQHGNQFVVGLAVLGLCAACSTVLAQTYSAATPEAVLTPDVVDTERLGTLRFFDGMPDEATVQKVYDNLIFMRGVEAFLSGIPATSIEAIRLGNAEVGATRANHVVIFDKLMDSNPLFLTGNTDTVYCTLFFDMTRHGSMVVEIPAGCGPGTVNDAFFRFVIDMGAPGPDRGKGGKYLLLPPEYDGPLQAPIGGKAQDVIINGSTEKMFVTRSPSYVNWLILRGFLVDGKPDAAAAMFRNGLKIYPLAKAANPPAMKFFNGSEKSFNTVHANNFEFNFFHLKYRAVSNI